METDAPKTRTIYRVYYDAWFLRMIDRPSKPDTWVKEVRSEDRALLDDAVRYGQALTKYSSAERPTTWYVNEITETERTIARGGVNV